jgi:hypothetical protein
MAFSTTQSEKRDFRIAPIFNDLASLKMVVYPERMDARVKFCPTAWMQETVLPDDSGILLEQEIIFSGVMVATVFYPGVLPENSSTLPARGFG